MDEQVRIEDQTVGGYLERLAARVPAPGGGAAAALHAAQGAALVGMVARYTSGQKYAEHAEVIARITAEADELRGAALALAAADAEAFTAVTRAYALPRGTEEEKASRSASIATALAGAARPPADVITAAGRVLALAEQLLPIANPNVITDVAAASDAARAAATTARLNVEINLAGIKNPALRADLTTTTAEVPTLAARADTLTDAVRTTLPT